MPKDTSTDWPLAMVLYAQGIRPQEISQRMGIQLQALYNRISKGKWIRLLTETRKTTEQALERLLQESNFRVRSAMARRLMYMAESMPDRSLPMRQEIALQRDLEPALRNAKTLFGWNDRSTTSPIVRINVLGTVSVESESDTKESLAASTPTPPPE